MTQKPVRVEHIASKEVRFQGVVEELSLGGAGCSVQAGAGQYFVSAAVPGDRVEITPTPTRGSLHAARLTEVLEPSEDRIPAACAVLHRCGGCSIQEMRYSAQLEAKRSSLVRMLGDLCEDSMVEAVQGLSRPLGYRTRLLMPAAPAGRNRGIHLGFYARGTTRLTDTSGCPVQHPLVLATLAMVKQVLSQSPIRATSSDMKGGWLHGLAIRVDPPSGSAELTLIGKTRKLPGAKTLAPQLAALPVVRGVHISVNPDRSSYMMGEDFVHVAGARHMLFHLAGQSFRLSPGSFFQTSHEGAELLVKKVLALMPGHMRCMADLYGGVGIFARVSHKRWKRAIVAESNPNAVADLKSWVRHTKTGSLRVLEGRVEDTIEEVLEQEPDVVVIDPPRSGCHARVLAAIGRSRPPVLIYVACGIEALVRDATTLKEFGYAIDQVNSVDMFPHTPHLEVVARFVQTGGGVTDD